MDNDPEGSDARASAGPTELAERMAALEQENRRLGEQVRSLMAAENKLFVLQDHLNAQQRVYVRLAELGRTLNATFDVNKILQAVTHFVVYGFNYERCVALVAEGKGPGARFRPAALEGYYDDALVERLQHATLTGREPALAGIETEPGFVCHAGQQESEAARELGQLLGLDEYFVFALPGKGGALRGLIVAGNTREQAQYQTGVDSEGEMLVAFSNLAAQAATAINNVESFNALERERELLDRVVSERTRELSEALDAAHEAVRLKSEFLANVSHELRTPLNSIVNVPLALLRDYTDVSLLVCGKCDAQFQPDADTPMGEAVPCPDCGHALEARPSTLYVGDPADHRHFLELVATQGSHLLRLVEDVLDFSRVDSGKLQLRPTSLELGELIAEVRATMESSAKGNECPVRYPSFEAPFHVVADRLRLKQILINLIGNALKFTPAEGEVRVKARELPGDEPRIELSVEDDGVGIPEDQFEAIFESFRQVDGSHTRNYSGVGLGLAITRQLVRLHGGEISVESQMGKGSVFRVWLPRDPSVGLDSSVRPAAAAGLAGSEPQRLGHGRVVVVDDEPSQLSIARRWLEREGYEVQLVGKPLATFDVVAESQPRFVLLDVMMREQSGLSVLAQLKRDERTSHIPVIVSSAFHQNPQKIAAAGGIWLPKPWNVQRMSAQHLEHLIREASPAGHDAAAPRVRRLSSLVSRILYVEDEDANWEVTELSLRGKYELVRARSSEEAFELLRSSRFDLVLLDIQLKGSQLNGIETCEVLTGHRTENVPELARGVRFAGPIVFVTAYAALHSRDELKQSGARELISKPVDFTHLLMVLSRIALQGAVSEIHAA